jgi:hypothetical protein
MKHILIFLLTMLYVTGFSQSWVKYIQTNEDEVVNSCIENPEGGYLLSVSKGDYSNDDAGRLKYREIIYKMSAQGMISDSIVFRDSDSTLVGMGSFITCANGLFYWGCIHSIQNGFASIGYRFVRLNYT